MSECRKCERDRALEDQYRVEGIDLWNTAVAMIKKLGGEDPIDPMHVLSLCDFLAGDK